MKRGEIWWIEFGSAAGGEIQKKRPAVIVSNNAANEHLNRVQVAPLTGSTERLYPSEAVVTFRGKKSKAMADQIATVSKHRLINKAGKVAAGEMKGIGRAIAVQLGL
jgi:mRNA interferase MazF